MAKDKKALNPENQSQKNTKTWFHAQIEFECYYDQPEGKRAAADVGKELENNRWKNKYFILRAPKKLHQQHWRADYIRKVYYTNVFSVFPETSLYVR